MRTAKKKVSTGTAKRIVAKVVEDKTFGMKNKKGSKARKIIAEVENQAKAKIIGRSRGPVIPEAQMQAEAKARKEAIKREAVMMAQMLGISVEDATAAFTGKKKKKKKPEGEKKKEGGEEGGEGGEGAEAEGEGEEGEDGKKKKGKKLNQPAAETTAIAKAQAARRALRRQRKREAGEEYEIDESMCVSECVRACVRGVRTGAGGFPGSECCLHG
jgi:hypothetical protein